MEEIYGDLYLWIYSWWPNDQAPFTQVAASSDGQGCSLDPAGSLHCMFQGVSPSMYDFVLDYPAQELFVQLSFAKWHGCAVTRDGRVLCVGAGTTLGSELLDHNEHGQSLPPDGDNFVEACAGSLHSCALDRDGVVTCWTRSLYGAVDVPEGVLFRHVVCGGHHTCGLTKDGHVLCWGGQHHPGVDPEFFLPDRAPDLAPPDGGAIDVAAGDQHACGLWEDGQIRCWGHNDGGQLHSPTSGEYVALSAQRRHTCALAASGGVTCWGGSYENLFEITPPWDEPGAPTDQ